MRPRVGLADAPAKRGDLRAEAAENMVKSVRKVASADCRRARATDFSLINDRVFFEFAGGAPTRCPKFPKFPDWKLPKFSSWKFLHSRVYARGTCRYRAGGGWRLRWHRQVLASGSREAVQSDQRRGASETGTVPTARVCHKEPFRARPHPSPEPARWSARTSGGGQEGTARPDRAARHVSYIGLETVPSGHLDVHWGSA